MCILLSHEMLPRLPVQADTRTSECPVRKGVNASTYAMETQQTNHNY